MAVVEPEEVHMLVSSPNLAQGSLMMQGEANSEHWKRRFARPNCVKKPHSNILLQQQVATKFDQMEENGWGQITPSRRVKTCSRVFQQARPIEEVHTVIFFFDEDGVEVAIPSICNPGGVTHVMISREKERFVNEIHTHEAKTRSRIARKCSRLQRMHVLQKMRGN